MHAAASSIRFTNAIEPCRIGLSLSRSWMRAGGYSCSTTEVRVGDVERQQLTRGELMIQPVNGAVLQIGQRIVSCRPG